MSRRLRPGRKRLRKAALDNRLACCTARYSAACVAVWKGGFSARNPCRNALRSMLLRIPNPVPESIAHKQGYASVLDQGSIAAPTVTMAVSDDTTEHHERQPARSRSGHPDRPQRTDHLRRLSPSTAERRAGKECVSTSRSRWSPYH